MKKRIVILGAGFGGLRAALVLGKEIGGKNEVILIDRHSHHTFTPLLYEVATTSKETANYIELHKVTSYEIADILKGIPIRFIQREVEEIDTTNGDIHLENGEKLKYDYLLVALGSETNFFDIPGLKESSLELKTFNDALRLRDRILEKISGENKTIKVVIGGGGSTGVELASELQNWLCELKEDNRECDARVIIVEAGPTVLNGFSPKIVDKVSRRLKNLGIQVLTNEAISQVSQGKASLKSGQEIEFDTLIWTGGVKANPIVKRMSLKTDKKGRSEVAKEMLCLPETPELKLHGKIYGIGDSICCYDKKGNPVPMVARAAISQANVASKNIISELNGREPKCTYNPMDYPYIIPVGGKYAVAKIGPVILSGLFGWLLKGVVELNYLVSIMPIRKALKIWFKGFKMFIQNDRLG